MRQLICTLGLLLVGAAGRCGKPRPATGPPSSDYTLVWADEFDGAQLNSSKWDYRQLGPRRRAINVKDTVALDNQGHVVLTTRRVGDQIHTAMIDTEGKFEPTFGLEWTPTEYVFYIDGRESWRSAQAVSHAKEYIILSLEVGDKQARVVRQQEAFEDAAYVDYVRVYQRPTPSDGGDSIAH